MIETSDDKGFKEETLNGFKLEGDLAGKPQEVTLTMEMPEPIMFSPMRRADTFEELCAAKNNSWFVKNEGLLGWFIFVVVYKPNGHRIQTRIPFNELGPRLADEYGLIKWGIVQLGKDVWALTDSLNLVKSSPEDKNFYHGYLVLMEVPETPPWMEKAVTQIEAELAESGHVKKTIDFYSLRKT